MREAAEEAEGSVGSAGGAGAQGEDEDEDEEEHAEGGGAVQVGVSGAKAVNGTKEEEDVPVKKGDLEEAEVPID